MFLVRSNRKISAKRFEARWKQPVRKLSINSRSPRLSLRRGRLFKVVLRDTCTYMNQLSFSPTFFPALSLRSFNEVAR